MSPRLPGRVEHRSLGDEQPARTRVEVDEHDLARRIDGGDQQPPRAGRVEDEIRRAAQQRPTR